MRSRWLAVWRRHLQKGYKSIVLFVWLVVLIGCTDATTQVYKKSSQSKERTPSIKCVSLWELFICVLRNNDDDGVSLVGKIFADSKGDEIISSETKRTSNKQCFLRDLVCHLTQFRKQQRSTDVAVHRRSFRTDLKSISARLNRAYSTGWCMPRYGSTITVIQINIGWSLR